MKYRKRPVVVDAVRYIPSTPVEEIIAVLEGNRWQQCDDGIEIATLEGVMHASKGDWIIRGIKGEAYPCKHDIFIATYEPAV